MPAFSDVGKCESGCGHFFGVVAVDDWAFIVEPNGFMGVQPDFDEIARRVGFDLAHSSESYFAMAEYLTGVKVTPELLQQSAYLCAVAPHSP